MIYFINIVITLTILRIYSYYLSKELSELSLNFDKKLDLVKEYFTRRER